MKIRGFEATQSICSPPETIKALEIKMQPVYCQLPYGSNWQVHGRAEEKFLDIVKELVKQ